MSIHKKICIVGEFGVGKTSLVSRYVRSIFSDKNHTTVGVKIDRKRVLVGGEEVTLVLWDLAGESALSTLRLSLVRGSAGFILVADGTRRETLVAASRLYDQVRHILGDVPFILAVNKTDVITEWTVTGGDIDTFVAAGWDIRPSSAKDGLGVDQLFDDLALRLNPEAVSSSLGSLFAALNCVAVEVVGDDVFIVSPMLPWLQSIVETDANAPNVISLLPYLEIFLVEARPFWRLGKPGWLQSDFWTQHNAVGEEVHLLAFATLIDGRELIVIRTADALYEERQRWELYAHETTLQLRTIEGLKSELERSAIALQGANERLSELSIRDDLTGLYNRRYFDQNFRAELNRSVRTGEPLSILFMDIDKFKVLNDTYGHSVGDECLRATAEVLRDTVRRSTDTVARFGGEEFAILLPATEAADAFLVATAINKAMRALNFPNEHSEVEPYVTASLGAYTRQPDGYSTVGQIMESVDAALYLAKKEGRNRVIVAAKLEHSNESNHRS